MRGPRYGYLLGATLMGSAAVMVPGAASAQDAAPAPPAAAAPAAPAAPAAEQSELPVTILTIQTLDAFEQAEALTTALKRAVDGAPGWSVPIGEKEWALQVLVLSIGCNEPPDAACEEKIAQEIKSDRFLWGVMQKQGNDVTGSLHLWTKGQGSKATDFRYSANLKDAADDTLLEIARTEFIELAGPPVGGKVRITAGNVDGKVLLDGKEVATMRGGKATIDVPVGAHKIEVVAAGYEPMEAQLDVKPREERDIALVPAIVEKGADVQKILGFISLGLGVAAGGVATFAGVQVMGTNSDLEPYRTGTSDTGLYIPAGADGCDRGGGDYPNLKGAGTDAARQEFADLCATGDTFQTLQLAMWPVAGVLAGTGIILLATADWSGDEEAKTAKLPFRIDPRFGPGGADVLVTVPF